jgi:hypothetical protein
MNGASIAALRFAAEAAEALVGFIVPFRFFLTSFIMSF